MSSSILIEEEEDKEISDDDVPLIVIADDWARDFMESFDRNARWLTRKEAINEMELLSLAQNRSNMVDKKNKGGVSLVLRCTTNIKDQSNCPFYCKLRRSKRDKLWYICEGLRCAHRCNGNSGNKLRHLQSNLSIRAAYLQTLQNNSPTNDLNAPPLGSGDIVITDSDNLQSLSNIQFQADNKVTEQERQEVIVKIMEEYRSKCATYAQLLTACSSVEESYIYKLAPSRSDYLKKGILFDNVVTTSYEQKKRKFEAISQDIILTPL